MDRLCEECWNEGCRANETLRASKVDGCYALTAEKIEEESVSEEEIQQRLHDLSEGKEVKNFVMCKGV